MAARQALWLPPADWRESTLVGELCQRVGVDTFGELRAMSLERAPEYWMSVMAHLGFQWREKPSALVDLSEGPAFPRWFPGGRLNWVDNVLAQADGPKAQQPAVITEREGGGVTTLSYAALATEVRQMAAGLAELGVEPGDRVGMMMPMGGTSISAFLGISAIGAIAVPLFTGFGADLWTRFDARFEDDLPKHLEPTSVLTPMHFSAPKVPDSPGNSRCLSHAQMTALWGGGRSSVER
jgi:acetyl-CoA synthetase